MTAEPVGFLHSERPRLSAVIKHLGLNLLTGNVIPSALFSLSLVLGNIWLALITALGWCYGEIAWRMSTGRRASGLLWITLLGLTAKTAFAFISGSTFLYLVQPALNQAVFALVFLASLLSTRPLVARLAADFYPMNPELAGRPRVQKLFWRLTLLWAVICAGQATASLWLMHALSTKAYVATRSLLTPTVAICGAALTVVLSVRVARREGLFATA